TGLCGLALKVLDERNVELPACFKLGTTPPSPVVHAQRDTCQRDDALGGGTQSRECQGPSMVSAMAFRHKPRQQQYRLEAEALPEVVLTGALNVCSSIYNVARALIEPRREKHGDRQCRRTIHTPSPDGDK
ncbi:hypothetical protein BIW11_10917, partial [Tropilaelaps mercedesae]